MLKKYKQPFIHISLFILTLISTTLAGTEWRGQYHLQGWDYVWSGLQYSLTFLGILTIHEFGHYYFSRKNNVDASLPYYIPFYIPGILSIGTFGAFIRMKSTAFSRKGMFDIGVAGPLAGFAVALIVLAIGFATLPEKEYIYTVHPEYEQFGEDYEKHVYTYAYLKHRSDSLTDITFAKDSLEYLSERKADASLQAPVKQYETVFEEMGTGKNILFWLFEKLFAYQGDKIPNSYEMFHYPLLFAAYLALFFTGLNLMPIGQLDGGHVIYGLFGFASHRKISTTIFIVFVFVGGFGMFKSNFTGVNFFTASFPDQLEFAVLYIVFLYLLFAKMYVQFLNALLTAVAIFAGQFLIEYLFTDITGFHGWLVFAFILGRFLGIYHPPALDERPLDAKRKLIGWLSLLIFILCFTPDVFVFETITK